MKAINSALNIVTLTGCAVMLFMVHGVALGADPASPLSPAVDVIVVVENTTIMNQRDPDHTRNNALKIFIALLNSDDRVGVISFGDNTQVMQELKALDSKGAIDTLFDHIDGLSANDATGNISNALNSAKQLVESAVVPDKRDVHVVLLTSGSTKPGQSSQPQLQQTVDTIPAPLLLWYKTGYIPVHVVTLGDPVDNTVAKNIASVTRGTIINSKNGPPLVATFSNLAANLKTETSRELAAPTFKVDNSMRYFKILAATGGTNMTLTTPTQQTISAANRPDNVLWRTDDSFTTVTVTQPEGGNWTIATGNTTEHPVTLHYASTIDIGYQLSQQAINAGDKIKVSAWLQKNNQPVTNPDIIKFLKVRLVIRRDGNVIDDSSLFPEKGAANRFFTYIQPDQGGDYTFRLSMQDTGFYRETRFSRTVATLKPAAQSKIQTSTAAEQAVKTVAEKTPQPQQSTIHDGGGKTMGILDTIHEHLPHLKKALVIATIINGVVIVIGGLAYFRRKMKQQSAETVDFLTSISSRNESGEADINNAAA